MKEYHLHLEDIMNKILNIKFLLFIFVEFLLFIKILIKKYMILIISDEEYISKAKILINSIRKFHDIKIHLHLVNYNIKLDVNNIEYSYSNLKLDNTNIKYWNSIKYTEKNAYCANIRVKIINQLLDNNEWILYIDADSIVRKSLNYFFKEIKLYDLSAHYCDKKKYYKNGFRIRTGVLGINNSSIMKEFMNYYSNKINLFEWFSDQDTLQDTYLNYKKNIKFNKINSKYIDWNFKNESHIWTGKGESKYNNQNYINEEKKFT